MTSVKRSAARASNARPRSLAAAPALPRSTPAHGPGLGLNPPALSPPSAAADPQSSTPLLDAVLARGRASHEAAFHIPGHKRGGEEEGDSSGHLGRLRALAGPTALAHDLTELAGLDVLSSPAGPIGAAQALAASAVGAAASRFLVNGSTGGLSAAVVAACAVWRGGKAKRGGGGGGAAAPVPIILAARNCHQSVFGAAAVAGADIAWVAPRAAGAGWAGVAPPLDPPALAAALARLREAAGIAPAAVVIVSPTYFGQVADVAGVCEWCGT